MSNVTLHPIRAPREEPALAIIRLNSVLEMTRTFQAFIVKTREVDRDDSDFQYAAQSCHDALTLNLCALRDKVLTGMRSVDPEILSRGPARMVLAEISRLESRLGK